MQIRAFAIRKSEYSKRKLKEAVNLIDIANNTNNNWWASSSLLKKLDAYYWSITENV